MATSHDQSKPNSIHHSFLNKSAKQYVQSIFGKQYNFFWFFDQVHIKWVFVFAQLAMLYLAFTTLVTCSSGNYLECPSQWNDLFSKFNDGEIARTTEVGKKDYDPRFTMRSVTSLVMILTIGAALSGMASIFSAEKIYNKKRRIHESFNIHPLFFAVPSYVAQFSWILVYFFNTKSNLGRDFADERVSWFRFLLVSVIPYLFVWAAIVYCYAGSLKAIKFIKRAAKNYDVDPELTINLNQSFYSRRSNFDSSKYRGNSLNKSSRLNRSGRYKANNTTGRKSPNRSVLLRPKTSKDRSQAEVTFYSGNRSGVDLEMIQEEELTTL
uniref:Uncharacterized protein n=1 Tax=Rhabditophanes sp. KR3021 TaxID=114890 RepID=A0AC35TSA4_9BILA